MKKISLIFFTISLFSCSKIQTINLDNTNDKHKFGKKYAIASGGIYSSQAAAKIIENGGNIYDAAIALSFMLSVERPQSTGIGGGGFMLFFSPNMMTIPQSIDFRERSPLSKNIKEGELEGVHTAGTPGLIAGLFEIHKRFGHRPWKELLQPAIELAKKGFKIYPSLAEAIKYKSSILEKNHESKKIFLDQKDILVQKDLAKTLERIAQLGPDVFYKGDIAKSIIKEINKQNGHMKMDDLHNYKPIYRDVTTLNYNDYAIYSMGLPSSGGIAISQILNTLKEDNLIKQNPLSVDNIHLTASATYMAFADRRFFLGDPKFHKIKFKHLLTDAYSQEQRKRISKDKALNPKDFIEMDIFAKESNETTHFSLMDNLGNIIVSTQTINTSFGSGITVPGTGIVLNDELDDFATKKSEGKFNLIQPGKIPLSSMSPTIVFKNNKPIFGLGSPGGARIISCVSLALIHYLKYEMSFENSIQHDRYHIQGPELNLHLENNNLDEKTIIGLKKLGYNPILNEGYCSIQGVHAYWEGKKIELIEGVSDKRDRGFVATE